MKQTAHCLEETLSKNPEYDEKRKKEIISLKLQTYNLSEANQQISLTVVWQYSVDIV